MTEKLCIKPVEAAEMVGVSLPIMYELCRRSDFPSIRIGRTILIPIDGLKAWLASQTKGDYFGP